MRLWDNDSLVFYGDTFKSNTISERIIFQKNNLKIDRISQYQ